jgi:hypothetical protein
MVAAWVVSHDWRNPDGIKTHSLDIVKFVDHSFVGSAAIVLKIRASVGAAVSFGKSISEYLVNTSLLPSSSVTSKSSGGKKSGAKSDINELHFIFNSK